MERCLVRIYAKSQESLQDLQKVYDLDVFRTTAKKIGSEFVVEALISKQEIGRLSAEGYRVDILTDAEMLGSERRKEVGAD